MSDGLMPSPECSGGTAGAKDPVRFLSLGEGMAFFSVRVAHAPVVLSKELVKLGVI